jgi:uncharacterized protein YjbI with pentapeptide repeats
MSPDKIQEILTEHGRWLRSGGGSRAVRRDADLRGADLSCAVRAGCPVDGARLVAVTSYGSNGRK